MLVFLCKYMLMHIAKKTIEGMFFFLLTLMPHLQGFIRFSILLFSFIFFHVKRMTLKYFQKPFILKYKPKWNRVNLSVTEHPW